jgi:hypothetical protein
MERHFSTGIATLAALMAAHRAAGPDRALRQEDFARFEASLLALVEIGVGGDRPGLRARGSEQGVRISHHSGVFRAIEPAE